jgi:hypothetical protein
MILVERVEPDLIIDEISGLRNLFDSHKTWTVAKKLSLENLIFSLRSRKYQEFTGNYKSYSLGPIGHSFLYAVPESQRGHLAPFRSKLVRIVCVARKSISTRVFYVGEIAR